MTNLHGGGLLSQTHPGFDKRPKDPAREGEVSRNPRSPALCQRYRIVLCVLDGLTGLPQDAVGPHPTSASALPTPHLKKYIRMQASEEDTALEINRTLFLIRPIISNFCLSLSFF